jgi:hypothetical protein
MSRCDLQIVFDRPNRTYRPGEELSGTVHAEVNRDVRCDGLVVEHFWQTHGRGNTATGPKQTQVLFQGDWREGETLSYPFRFTTPDGPPTYHGHYLNVDHYVHVRVDVPWAIDPKLKEEYLLLPGQHEYGNLPPSHDRQPQGKKQVLKLGLPVGVAMIVAGLLLVFPCGLVLIPLGCILLLAALRQSLAEKKIGKVELRLGSLRVAPGDSLPLELRFTPRKSSTLGGITARLAAVEECVSGSGTNRTTHTHKIHEQTFTLAPQGQLTAGRPMEFRTVVPIPQTNAFSFSASDNKLTWTLEVRIDIPMWPDWVEKRTLTVRPVPVAEIVAKKVEKKGIPWPTTPAERCPPEARKIRAEAETAAGVSPQLATPAADDLGTAGMTLTPGSDVTLHQPPPAQPTPAEGPAEAAAAAVDGQPAADATAPDSALLEIIERLGSASRYGSQRDQILGEYAEQSFPCTIEIDDIERTYSYVPDKRFRNGRTVTGVIRGTDCAVSVQMPEERNEQLDALTPGEMLQANCQLIKWNNIHDRLELREA